MGSKRKKAISDELLDALLSGEDAKDAFNNGELLDELKGCPVTAEALRGHGTADGQEGGQDESE